MSYPNVELKDIKNKLTGKKIKKIFILGTVGSGKSTLAKKISRLTRVKHYDLDDIYWTDKINIRREKKERRKLLERIFRKNEWIVEGVYVDDIDKGIKKSDIVILLNPSLITLIWRISKRMIKREKSKEIGTKRYNENLKSFFELLKTAWNYKKKSNQKGFYAHKKIISKEKVRYIIIHKKNFSL